MRGEFGAIDGDEVLLRQAFSNLLRNALEACADASRAADDRRRVGRRSRAATSRIAVDDNGPGIDRRAARARLPAVLHAEAHGTGLGLALVQKIIVFHNGRISVGTSPLGGASLQIVLPVRA